MIFSFSFFIIIFINFLFLFIFLSFIQLFFSFFFSHYFKNFPFIIFLSFFNLLPFSFLIYLFIFSYFLLTPVYLKIFIISFYFIFAFMSFPLFIPSYIHTFTCYQFRFVALNQLISKYISKSQEFCFYLNFFFKSHMKPFYLRIILSILIRQPPTATRCLISPPFPSIVILFTFFNLVLLIIPTFTFFILKPFNLFKFCLNGVVQSNVSKEIFHKN